MAGRLEQRWKGDRFRMLDPASLPEKPYFPKPPLIVGLGAILGLFVGLGAALVAEYLDPTIKDTEDLQAFLDVPRARPHPAPPQPRRLDDAMTDEVTRASVPGVVSFLDEGVVTQSRPCPIVASLRDAHSIVGEELRLLRSRLRTGWQGRHGSMPGPDERAARRGQEHRVPGSGGRVRQGARAARPPRRGRPPSADGLRRAWACRRRPASASGSTAVSTRFRFGSSSPEASPCWWPGRTRSNGPSPWVRP